MEKNTKIPKQIYFTPREVEIISFIAEKRQISFSEQVRRILDKEIDSILIKEYNKRGGDLV